MKVTNELVTEESFLEAFSDIIKYFSENPSYNEGIRVKTKDDLFNVLSNPIANKKVDMETTNNDYRNKKLTFFIDILDKIEFKHGLIPYDKITECVFDQTPEEMLYFFTSDFKKYGDEYFEGNDAYADKTKQSFYKIIRHIDLALIQKNSFANLKISEMDDLKRDYERLNKQYQNLKNDADKQYRAMLTHFISILGIFAAILMGAFGAIQGFNSLFDNAIYLSIGKILIISSIGASSIILILFFLLNAIAKLTKRSLSSSSKENPSIFEKYPTLVITHGILIFISLIGAALELSNIKITIAAEGFWWLLPIGWIIYFVFACNTKSWILFSKNSKIANNKEAA